MKSKKKSKNKSEIKSTNNPAIKSDIKSRIKIVGVGGAGGNTVSRMKKYKIEGIELIAINTDYQDLNKIRADVKLRIGKRITQGLGTGMKPEIGEMAAKESKDEIMQTLKGGDMIFITYGAGGGTGSGAGPVIAEIAKKIKALTVAIVTTPFSFEGKTRMEIAKQSLAKLKEQVDSLVIIKNDKLLEILDPKTSLISTFTACDDILRQAVQGISDLILLPGLIDVDFADVKAILKNSGTALFGIGNGQGEKRVEVAIRQALNSPLLDLTPKGAKGILFNVAGGDDLSLSEIEEIGETLTKEINPDAKILFGAIQDSKLKRGEIKLTVIATGF